MTEGFQVTREAALATAHVECLPAGRWYRRQKEVAMKTPVAVVARLSGPDNPGCACSFQEAPRSAWPRRFLVNGRLGGRS